MGEFVMRRVLLLVCAATAWGQEANSGFELRTTMTVQGMYSEELTQAPRDGDSVAGGVRGMFYPVWKLSSHWSMEGTVEVHTRPFFSDEISTQGYGIRADVLQAHLNYSRFWNRGSVVVRAGMLSSSFGSFLLRYDDAVNPLIGVPLSYGYYSGESELGLAGAQVDVTEGKVDLRGQFSTSSPVNRRSIFDADQYGNWTFGGGYTIAQGFRAGASMFRGPYLDRQSAFYYYGEANPSSLPATGVGVDVQWGSGPWNVYGEWRRFQFDYQLRPTFTEHTGYAEVRRVLTPRWFAAARLGYLHPGSYAGTESYEIGFGYRPNTFQLIKASYAIEHSALYPGTTHNVLAVQLVSSLQPLSFTRK